jgi:hypothetical protein
MRGRVPRMLIGDEGGLEETGAEVQAVACQK